jgi:hypothetical protein
MMTVKDVAAGTDIARIPFANSASAFNIFAP